MDERVEGPRNPDDERSSKANTSAVLLARDLGFEKAIEEGDVAAWHTPFPHLFLPDLGEEAIAELAVSLELGD